MRQWGRVDFKQLEDLQKRIEKLERMDAEKFVEKAAKELAARLLAKVIKRTPVGQYDDGRVGGTLRRGWTAKTEREAELSSTFGANPESVKKFVDALTVTKSGGTYEIEIINPVSYAIYVEYGHRTSNHKGWVDGRFMLTISEQELESQMPAILERKLQKELERALIP